MPRPPLSPIIVPSSRKPLYPARLTKRNPLTKGLNAAWLINEGGGNKIFDVVRQKLPLTLSSGYWANKAVNGYTAISGAAISTDTSGILYGGSFGSDVLLPTNQPFTISYKVALSAATAYGQILVFIQDGSTYPFRLMCCSQAAYQGFSFSCHDTWVSGKDGLATVSIPGIHHIVLTYNGLDPANLSNFSMFRNGVKRTLSSTTAYNTNVNVNRFLGEGIAGAQPLGALDHIYMWNRVLTDGEIISLYHRPYQMFQPQRSMDYIIDMVWTLIALEAPASLLPIIFSILSNKKKRGFNLEMEIN